MSSITPDGTAESRANLPLERLTITRERLRQALAAPVAAREAETLPPGWRTVWLDNLHRIPAAQAALDALQSWWAHHPWRVPALMAGDASQAMLRPVAKRHPMALVLGAVVFGAMLVWSGPGRRLLRPALLLGLLPRLIGRTLSRMPMTSWMAVLASLTKPVASASAPSGAAPQRLANRTSSR